MAHLNFNLTRNSTLLNDERGNVGKEAGIGYFVLAPALGVVMLFAIFGNITLIVTISRTSKLRTRTNIFILNLACADLGVALLCMPFSIITCFTRDWIFGDILCQLNGFMNIVFEASSLFTLTAISIEKYFFIVKPMTVVITTRVAFTMVAMTWITALALAAIPLTSFITFEFKTGSTQCGVQIPETVGQTVYASLILLAAFLIPLCIMGFCYINIFRAAKQHSLRVSRMSLSTIDSEILLNSQNQISLTIFILLIVFIICWTPFFSYMMYMSTNHIKNPDEFEHSLGLVSYWFAFLNSSINPFVYGVRNPLIRKELMAKCCRRFRNGQRRRSSDKPHRLDHDFYPGPPQPFAGCNISPVYPAYINVVTLSEEEIVSPNEGTGKLTTDRETQTGQVCHTLSVQDLPHVYFTNKPSFTRNEIPLSESKSLSPLQQKTYTDSANEVTCSTCSSTCSESDYVTIGGSDDFTCSSESELNGLCGECESSSQCSTNGPCCCQGHENKSNSCSLVSSYTNESDYRLKNKNKATLVSTTLKSREKFKVGWIESQL